MRRTVPVIVLVVLITLGLVSPALATTPTTYVSSQGISATVVAADADVYQLSLYGSNSLDFGSLQPGQSGPSQNSLVFQNDGNRAFQLLISADYSPTNGWATLPLVDYSPGTDQVMWTLNGGWGELPITDWGLTDFGTLQPGNGVTLSSTLYMGGAISYTGQQYNWTATAYAVPF